MEKGRGAEGGQLLLGAAQEQGAGEQIHRQVPPLDVQQARGDVPSGLLDIQRWDLTVDLLSCSLLLGRSQEELAPLRTPALLHYCKATRKFTPSTSRMEFLWALLAQRDPEAALLSWRQFQRCAPRWPYPATLDTDRRLMELGLQRAQGQGFPLPPL